MGQYVNSTHQGISGHENIQTTELLCGLLLLCHLEKMSIETTSICKNIKTYFKLMFHSVKLQCSALIYEHDFFLQPLDLTLSVPHLHQHHMLGPKLSDM